MDLGLRTPLLEFFRRGEVPREVRLLAARGGLGPQALEQLGLLVILSDDSDLEVATVAADTIDSIPRDTLRAFLARTDVTESLKAFFIRRGIEPSGTPLPDSSEPLVDRPDELPTTEHLETEGGTKMLSLLSVMERMKLAFRGTREQRSVLIRDPNKLVATAVLSCPKLTDTEVESYARMANVSEEVLRIIGTTRAWVKNYAVAASLSKNPKTPIAISLQLIPRLTDRDIKMLATSRNVPEAVRALCRKFVTKAQDRQ
jgi:hypothetical protein